MSDVELVRRAFGISQSQLYSQKADLRNARNQASLLAALSGLVATFFVNIVKPVPVHDCWNSFCVLSFNPAIIAVLICFVGTLFFAARAFVGWKDCRFELNPRWILAKELKSIDEVVVLRELTRDADKYFDENEDVIKDAMQNVKIGVQLVFMQIAFWIVLLVV